MIEIIDILKKFQTGYDEKNTQNITAFMDELFSDRQDLLTLGTNTWEVCLGSDEVTKLIHDDWNGSWGDFKIDMATVKIDVDGSVAWFYADCTLKYKFKDADEKAFERYNKQVREIIANENATPKQRLSFLNWVFGLHFHQRTPSEREYLWPSEFNGMLIQENDKWKIATLHFAAAKPSYPSVRFEDTVENYEAITDAMRKKMMAHNGNKADSELVDFLKETEKSLQFNSDQIAVFTAGHFSWVMALVTEKKSISEDEIFEKSLSEIEDVLNSNLSEEEKLFSSKRNIAYALKEVASGATYTWVVRLTAVVEKTENGYKVRNKHLSYPFPWLLEGIY